MKCKRSYINSQLDGGGCSASISYKTYFDKEEVRASCKYHSFLSSC